MSRQHASNADAERWGIVGVGLMPWDRKMYDTLKKQDCLYTLLLRGNASSDARVMAWWDYGYQIAGIANRTTIADGTPLGPLWAGLNTIRVRLR